MELSTDLTIPTDDTRRRASETFVLSLCDPRDPQTCAALLLGCVAILENVDPQDIRVYYSAFCDAAMVFLTSPRDSAEIKALRTAMRCCCDTDRPPEDDFPAAMHFLARAEFVDGPNVDDAIFNRWIARMATLMDRTLSTVNPDGRFHRMLSRSQRARRHGKSFPWPESHTNVLPSGRRASIEHLVGWFQWNSELFASTVSLISTIITLCRAQVLPFVITHRPLVNILILSVKRNSFLWSNRDKDVRVRRDLDANTLFLDLVAGAQLLNSLRGCMDHSDMSTFAYTVGQAPPGILHACNSAYCLLPELSSHLVFATTPDGNELDRTRKAYLDFAAFVVSESNPTKRRDAGSLHPDIIAQCVQQARQRNNLQLQVFNFMRSLADKQQCAAPGCFNTYAEFGRAFRQCSGCGRVPFCSRECQRRAWRHPSAPHRDACAALKGLSQKAHFGKKIVPEDFSRFSALRLFHQVDAWLRTAWYYMHGLNKEKFEYFHAVVHRKPLAVTDFGPSQFFGGGDAPTELEAVLVEKASIEETPPEPEEDSLSSIDFLATVRRQ